MNNYLFLVFILISTLAVGQTTAEKLKKDQDILLRKIANTKLLLDKTKSNSEASLNELKLIDNQVRFREELVQNFDKQVRNADYTIEKKDQQIKELVNKLAVLKSQYKKLVIYAYKHRNKFGKLMFIFSSDSYFEAIKRNKYLEKMADLQKKQFVIIRQHQGLISREIEEVKKKKNEKMLVLREKKKEKESMLVDKIKQEKVYQQFKQEEDKLLAELKADEKKKQQISNEIEAAIRREIALAEEKRRKEEAARAKAAAEAAARAAAEKKKANKPKVEAVEEKPDVVFKTTTEAELLNRTFVANKGKLPWPVEKGTVTEYYGKNAHPTFENVFTNNNGIDISAPKFSEIRAVFEGEVTSILNIPGAGKVVIIKHGNYRTVYSNLQNTYVKVGDKVTTKESIGSLFVKPDYAVSVLHFEVHLVSGTGVQSLNPVHWINR
ncbi:MAG: murein hydrolase activator EnvC family protein [Bacteroidota bacterium]